MSHTTFLLHLLPEPANLVTAEYDVSVIQETALGITVPEPAVQIELAAAAIAVDLTGVDIGVDLASPAIDTEAEVC